MESIMFNKERTDRRALDVEQENTHTHVGMPMEDNRV